MLDRASCGMPERRVLSCTGAAFALWPPMSQEMLSEPLTSTTELASSL